MPQTTHKATRNTARRPLTACTARILPTPPLDGRSSKGGLMNAIITRLAGRSTTSPASPKTAPPSRAATTAPASISPMPKGVAVSGRDTDSSLPLRMTERGGITQKGSMLAGIAVAGLITRLIAPLHACRASATRLLANHHLSPCAARARRATPLAWFLAAWLLGANAALAAPFTRGVGDAAGNRAVTGDRGIWLILEDGEDGIITGNRALNTSSVRALILARDTANTTTPGGITLTISGRMVMGSLQPGRIVTTDRSDRTWAAVPILFTATGTSTNPNTITIGNGGGVRSQDQSAGAYAVWITLAANVTGISSNANAAVRGTGAHTTLNVQAGGEITSTHNQAVVSQANNTTITVAGTITAEGRGPTTNLSGNRAIDITGNDASITLAAGGLLETSTCLRADTAVCPANASTSRGYGISIAGENANITLGTSGTGISFDETTASNNARILTQGPDSHGIRLFADGNAATTNIGRITTYADSLISTTGAGAHGILIDNTIGATNTAPVALDLGGRIEVTGANAVGLQLSDTNLALADVDGDTTNGGEIRITGGISATGTDSAAIVDSSGLGLRLLLAGAASITGDINLGAGGDTLILSDTAAIGTMTTRGNIAMGDDDDAVTFNSSETSYLSGLAMGAGDDTLTLMNANLNLPATGMLDGGGDTDTLIGYNTAATWIVAPAATGNSYATGVGTTSARSLPFTGFENLTGGTMADAFSVSVNHTGNLTGGGGADIFNLSGGTLTGNIFGQPGNDRLELSGTTARIGTGTAVTDRYNIYMADGDDVVTFNSTATSYLTEIELGTGDDALTLNANVDIDFTNGGIDLGGGGDTLTLNSYAMPVGGLPSFGDSGDTLTLNGAATLGTGTAANARQIIDMGTGDDAVTFNSSQTSYLSGLTMGAGDDTLTLNANLNLPATGMLDGGGDTDTLIGYNTNATWIVAPAATGSSYSTGVGTPSARSLPFTNFEGLTGGSMDDIFNISTNHGGALTGGAGNDSFNLSGGTLTGNIFGQPGNDRLELSGTTARIGTGTAVTDRYNIYMADGDDVVTFNSTATSYLTEIELGTGDDTLTLNANVNIDFTNGGIDLGTGGDTLILNSFVLPVGNAVLTSFGPGNDRLELTGAAAIGRSVSGTMGGSATINEGSIDMGGNDDAVIFNSSADSYLTSIFTGLGDDELTFMGSGTTYVSNPIVMGDGADEFTLSAPLNLTNSTPSNAVIDGGGDNDMFTLNNTLTGGLLGGGGDDMLTLNDGSSITGSANLGAGSDTLSYGTIPARVTMTLMGSTAEGFSADYEIFYNGGPNTGISGRVSGMDILIGTAATGDVLQGHNVAATWALGASETYTVAGTGGTSTHRLTFRNIENLLGGSGIDTFNISADYDRFIDGLGDDDDFNLTGGTFTGTIQGGAGDDMLGLTNNAAIGTSGNGASIDMGDGDDSVNFALAGASHIGSLTMGAGDDTLTLNANLNLPATGMLDGGGDTDTLIGYNTNATWIVAPAATGSSYSTGVGTPSARSLPFTNFEGLTGGSMDDIFNVSINHAGDLRGGAGEDSFNLSGGTLTGNIFGQPGNDRLELSGTTAAIGSNVSSTITRQSINMGDGDDEITFNSTATSYLTDIDLGADNDTLTLSANIDISGSLTGGAGTDTLIGYDAAATWTLARTANSGANTYATGTGTSARSQTFAEFQNLTGGSMNDAFTLTAAHAGNLDGGAGDDRFTLTAAHTGNLNGGAGDDTLILETGGSISGIANLGAGSDTLSWENRSSRVRVRLFGSNDQGFTTLNNIGLTIIATDITGGASGIDELVAGSDTNDQLIGYFTNSIWNLASGGNTYLADGRTLRFRNFEYLQGDGAADTFNISIDNGSTLDGAFGNNIFNFTAGMFTGTVLGNNANDTLTVSSAAAIGTANSRVFIRMRPGNDTVTFDSTATSYINNFDLGTGNDMLTLGSALNISSSLTGDAGNDTLTLEDNGSITGNVSLGADSDTLSYANRSTAVSVTLASSTADGFATTMGGATGITGTVEDINTLTGGTGMDTLTGYDADATWTLGRTGNSGSNTYAVTVGTGNSASTRRLTFTNFENLTGSAMVDNFTITGSHTGNLSSGAEDDVFTLSDNAMLTGNIDTGDGDDTVTVGNMASGASIVGNITLGDGDDTLTIANAAVRISGLADGGPGMDTLNGLELFREASASTIFSFVNFENVNGEDDLLRNPVIRRTPLLPTDGSARFPQGVTISYQDSNGFTVRAGVTTNSTQIIEATGNGVVESGGSIVVSTADRGNRMNVGVNITGAGASLTNRSGGTITGAIGVYADANNLTTFDNQGTITGGVLFENGGAIGTASNSGTINGGIDAPIDSLTHRAGGMISTTAVGRAAIALRTPGLTTGSAGAHTLTTEAGSNITTTGMDAHGIHIVDSPTSSTPLALTLGGDIAVMGMGAVGLLLSDMNLILADTDGDASNGEEISITGNISATGDATQALVDNSGLGARLRLDGAMITGAVDLGAGDDTLDMTGSTTITGAVDFGAGDDRLTLNDSGTITGSLSLGAGADTLDYSNRSTIVAVTLTGSDADGFAGSATDTGGFTGVNTLTAGSAMDDALTGYNVAATWTVATAGNTYGTGTGQNARSLTFSGFENLTGGTGMDTLTGYDADATWEIDGGMDATYTTGSGQNAETLTFRNIENLTGGAMMDTFTISTDHTGNLDGGAGDDSFTLSAGTLTGNLTGGDDNDTVTMDGDARLVGDITLGTGDDTLTFASADVRFFGLADGGPGMDTLNGLQLFTEASATTIFRFRNFETVNGETELLTNLPVVARQETMDAAGTIISYTDGQPPPPPPAPQGTGTGTGTTPPPTGGTATPPPPSPTDFAVLAAAYCEATGTACQPATATRPATVTPTPPALPDPTTLPDEPARAAARDRFQSQVESYVYVDPTGPSVQASAVGALTTTINTLISQRLSAYRRAARPPVQVAATALLPGMLARGEDPLIWGELFASDRQRGRDGRTLSYSHEYRGVLFGAEQRYGQEAVLGLMLGYADADVSTHITALNVETGSLFGGVYGRLDLAGLAVDVGLNLGYEEHDNQRFIPQQRQTAETSTHSFFINPSLTVSQSYRVEALSGRATFRLTPSLSMSYTAAFYGDYTERGAAGFNLSVDSRTAHNLTTRLQLGGDWALPKSNSGLGLRLGLQSRFTDSSDFEGTLSGASFSYASDADKSVHSLYVGVDGRHELRDNLKLLVDVEYNHDVGEVSERALSGIVRLEYAY